MNDLVEIKVFSKRDDLWKLISSVAEKELSFSEDAINYYGQNFSNEKLYDRMLNGSLIVYSALYENNVVGCFVGTMPEGGVATIIWLIVKSGYQSKGIGKQLFDQAVEAYKKMGCHKLKLTANNQRAVHFYEKNGMKIEGLHPNHWWNMDFYSLGMCI